MSAHTQYCVFKSCAPACIHLHPSNIITETQTWCQLPCLFVCRIMQGKWSVSIARYRLLTRQAQTHACELALSSTMYQPFLEMNGMDACQYMFEQTQHMTSSLQCWALVSTRNVGRWSSPGILIGCGKNGFVPDLVMVLTPPVQLCTPVEVHKCCNSALGIVSQILPIPAEVLPTSKNECFQLA